MIFTVYLITNQLNGKVYVGQTVDLKRRWSLHKSRSRHTKMYTAHLYNAIRKYGLDNFEIKTIATCETEEWPDYLEILYILIYDSTNPKVGYNMTTGGDKPHPTPEMRERQRQKLLGFKHPPEFGQRQSEALRKAWAEGRHTGTRGKKASPETKARVAEGHRGRKSHHFKHHICSEELVFLWNSGVLPKDIAVHFGIHRSTVERRVKSTGLPYHKYSDVGGRSGKNSPQYKQIDEELMKELFFQNVSIRQIGLRLGIDHHGITKRINNLGLTRKKPE